MGTHSPRVTPGNRAARNPRARLLGAQNGAATVANSLAALHMINSLSL